MYFIYAFFKDIKNIIYKHYTHYKYNSLTIAEKFRKQGAKIGNNCVIHIKELADEPYLIEIGNNVHINQNVRLFTHEGASSIFREEIPYIRYFGKIIIEDNCFIGLDAMILPGARIGRNSIIGAGAVVIGDVKPGSVMLGNPAIRVSTTEKFKQRCLEEWKTQGLTKFESIFEGKNSLEIQKIMRTQEFRKKLREHLCSVSSSKFFKSKE